MSVIKKDSSATSAVLFLNFKGEPLRFFIRPGPTKVQLQPLILHGGGVLCRTQEPNAILLADPGDITAAVGGAGHFYISTQYIRDCVAQNQPLDIESYRFSNAQAVQTRAVSRKQCGPGRMGYSPEDDTAILSFIARHRKDAKGNRVWQQMERQGVTSHSWQSMKDRFLKHLKQKMEQKSPDNKKKASLLNGSSSSEDNSFQPTPKRAPRKKAVVVSSPDSDSTQIGREHEGGATAQPDLQPSPEKISSPQDPASEKRQTDEVRKEADGDESVAEEEQPQDSEEPEAAGMNTDTPAMDSSFGPNDQVSSSSEKQNSPKPATPSRRKLGILERAAREFEDSQAIDGSQEDQRLSQASPINASDTDETQIMAARERAVRKQVVNPVPVPVPASQNHSSTLGPENGDSGPSRSALTVTSDAHMFLFQESQEELSQPSEEDQPSQSLLETKQHVLRLMQESEKDLVEVMKALLKASGDVTLALSYLIEGYNLEAHGPIWTQHDDEMLLSADSFECERLHEKFGVETVSKRAAFLKGDL